jgi:uncharacterized membrane protein YgcG
VRGFLHIEQVEEKKLGLFSSTDYVFRLEKPEAEWSGLEEHEERYLAGLFKYAEDGAVELSKLKNKFYKELKGIRKAVYEQLVAKGHYDRDPERVKGAWAAGGVGLLIVGAAGFAWLNDSGALPFLDPITLVIAFVVSGFVMLVFGQIMPARTEKGARAREWALGFKEFLERVEEPRYKRMITSPDMFERFLAYAMAFKVEAKWARAFEDMYAEPPRWYTGPHGAAFHASAFTHDMSAMSTAASSTMASSPSGSGGGGSSGGGSGGGGGGGF